MAKIPIVQDFIVDRDKDKCISCQVCCRMCSNDAHTYDRELDQINTDSHKCVGCHFCESFCPTSALTVRHNASDIRPNAS
jgi:ferredoxin